MNMRNDLVGDRAVILQDVVAIALQSRNVKFRSNCDSLGQRKQISQVLIRNVVKLLAVVLGDDQGMPLGRGANIEKGIRFRRFSDFLGGDFPTDDFAKDAAGRK